MMQSWPGSQGTRYSPRPGERGMLLRDWGAPCSLLDILPTFRAQGRLLPQFLTSDFPGAELSLCPLGLCFPRDLALPRLPPLESDFIPCTTCLVTPSPTPALLCVMAALPGSKERRRKRPVRRHPQWQSPSPQMGRKSGGQALEVIFPHTPIFSPGLAMEGRDGARWGKRMLLSEAPGRKTAPPVPGSLRPRAEFSAHSLEEGVP